MITSKINDTITYKQDKGLRNDDVGNVSSSYETEYLDVTFLVALGKRREEKNVAHYPVYLIHKDKFVDRIGILEVEKDKAILDDEGDVDLDKAPEFMYFDFVTKEYLNTYSYESDTGTDSDDIDEDIELDEEEHTWINDYMDDLDYGLLDNEGGGDCLFATIRDAYEGVGEIRSVEDLRKILTEKATHEVYENYKMLYDSFVGTLKENDQKMKELKKRNEEIKKTISSIKSREEKKKLLEEAKSNVELFKGLTRENATTKELLDEYIFMKSVANFEDFKKALLKKSYWADTWAISTLEQALNIKIIILSSEHYEQEDYENVMLCGQANDDLIEKKGTFSPDLYMIVDHLGNHYKLITYKNNRMFDFANLPNGIKEMIRVRCLERMSGVYSYIPDFQKYIEMAPEESVEEVVEEPLYDKDEGTVFMFYERSSNKPFPGKGTGENIKPENMSKYEDLKMINNWRQMLSTKSKNVRPINLDSKEWLSIEHYVQANKVKKSDPEAYYQLSLDSGSEESKDVSKIDRFLTEKIRVIDDEYDRSKLLEKAFKARIEQDLSGLSRSALEEKQKAKLLQYRYGKPPELMNELMKVRKNIQ